MKKLIAACAIGLLVAAAAAADGSKRFSQKLDGYQEDAVALSTTGNGSFHARISSDGTRVAYELSYRSMEGVVSQAHIHLGRQSQSGGIIVFLCTNLGNGPAGTQACPASPARITGVLEADDVVGPAGQGIAPMEFAEFLRALRNGATYVNVHTDKYPPGEIRGNLDGQGKSGGGGNGHGGHDDDDDDDDDDD
jgi:hypothetical protein